MHKLHVAIGSLFAILVLAASASAEGVRTEIEFPNLPGYQTLKCDLHTHTVFSDGSVWPPVRADEAWRQGLDATAIADHIEYQPHKDDVPTKHGRANELAAGRARERNLLFPLAAEITRDTPPGHFNAIFLKDVRPLDTEDFVEAVRRANEQGAFVFWNHQGWKGSEKGRWLEVHTTLLNHKWFQGMEVANGDEYYPEAHQWCLDKNLTPLGNSDIHDPDMREKSESGNHRTLTLVFAKERSLEGLKEALLAGRTAVWYKDQILGRSEWLQPLLNASLKVAKPHLRGKDALWLEIRNTSNVDVRLERSGPVGPATLLLPACATCVVKVATPEPKQPLELRYTAVNFLIAPGKGLPVVLPVAGP